MTLGLYMESVWKEDRIIIKKKKKIKGKKEERKTVENAYSLRISQILIDQE